MQSANLDFVKDPQLELSNAALGLVTANQTGLFHSCLWSCRLIKNFSLEIQPPRLCRLNSLHSCSVRMAVSIFNSCFINFEG